MTLFVLFGYQNANAQDGLIIPPSIKKVDYANREITFSGVTMNGQKTTYLEVEKGATVKIKTRIESKRDGNYCPACIVQVYWGIHDYTSVCAKSFYGYNFKKKKSENLKNKCPSVVLFLCLCHLESQGMKTAG